MTELNLHEWDKFLTQYPDSHFMQSSQWGELKSTFGWEPVRISTDDAGAQLLFRKFPFGLTFAYLPKGPIGKASALLWEKIDISCKKRNAIFLKIEADFFEGDPNFRLEDYSGFQLSLHNIQPPNTILISLEETEEILLKGMGQKTRYNIRLASRKGVEVETWDDIPTFHKMIIGTGERDNFGVHSKDYYQKVYDLFHPHGMCELLVAKYENQPLAAVMILFKGKTAWYVYGASTNLERNRMPAYILQWEAIRKAKEKGCLEYDLWGIPDQPSDILEKEFLNHTKGLWGVYRFKRGFGGKVKRNIQSMDKVYQPFLYKLYSIYMKVRTTAE